MLMVPLEGLFLMNAPQPCQLTLREPAARLFCVVNGCLEIAASLQHVQHLAIADRLQGVGVDWNTGGHDPSNLLHHARCEHAVHARVDSSIEIGARSPRSGEQRIEGRQRLMALPVARQGLARRFEYLEGTEHPLAVVWTDFFSRCRVGFLEAAEDRRGIARPLIRQPGADFGVSRRRGKQPDKEGADVEVGAADHDRGTAAVCDIVDRCLRLFDELAGRKALPGIGHVDQMVTDSALILRRRFVGADVEPPVYGEGIGRHDLPTQKLGDLESETRFSGTRRPENEEEGREGGRFHLRERSLILR